MLQPDMEQALENLDRRLTRVGQILPTLATKDDLEVAKQHNQRLSESLQQEIRIVADGLGSLTGQVTALTEHVKAMTSQVVAVNQQVAAVTWEIATVSERLDGLTDRLERKGVI